MKKKSVVSLGMFDLLKGFVMITIVLGHTISMYTFEKGLVITPILDLIYAFFMLCGKPVLFIVSGYGFRKSPMKNCISAQSKYILKPYAYAAVGTCILHLFTRYLLFKSVRQSIKATWYLAVGFLLGTPENHVFGGQTYYSCGPMWYILALYVGWIVYNAIVTYVPEKYVGCVSALCLLLGCGLEYFSFDYYCIPQGLCATFYIHLGYMIKRKKILHRDIDKKFVGISVLVFVFILAYSIITNQAKDAGVFLGRLDPLLTLAMGFGGAFLLIYLLQINRLDIKHVSILSKIGNLSLFIFCVHTAEMHGIPWYLFVEKYGANSVITMFAHYMLRCAFITVVVLFITKRKVIFNKLKGEK